MTNIFFPFLGYFLFCFHFLFSSNYLIYQLNKSYYGQRGGMNSPTLPKSPMSPNKQFIMMYDGKLVGSLCLNPSNYTHQQLLLKALKRFVRKLDESVLCSTCSLGWDNRRDVKNHDKLIG